MKHKLAQVMLERNASKRLKGKVQMDDAYIGGQRPGRPGRGAAGKTPFVAAVVDFGFNLTPRDIQQGFSGSFETLLSISVSIETEMMTAFDEGRGGRRCNNSTTFGGMAGRTI
jgi:hypothetical protein